MPKPTEGGGPVDYTNRRYGAQVLAGRIEQYWHAEGHPEVVCTVEPVRDANGKIVTYSVTSNLTDKAMPPRD